MEIFDVLFKVLVIVYLIIIIGQLSDIKNKLK